MKHDQNGKGRWKWIYSTSFDRVVCYSQFRIIISRFYLRNLNFKYWTKKIQISFSNYQIIFKLPRLTKTAKPFPEKSTETANTQEHDMFFTTHNPTNRKKYSLNVEDRLRKVWKLKTNQRIEFLLEKICFSTALKTKIEWSWNDLES